MICTVSYNLFKILQFNCMKEHGTRVVIYNLWEDEEEQLELDFDADPHVNTYHFSFHLRIVLLL